jgi:hypothetical protein
MNWRRKLWVLPKKYLFYASKSSLTYRKILHEADGFAAPPKEGVLRIIKARKNPSSSAGFEHANLGYDGKHANH